jgi:hypothetical protein
MILETDKNPFGVVGLNKENTDLAVYEKPNQHCLNPSGRYALPFSISIKAKRGWCKTLMITSSVSGEGKHSVL